MQSPLLGPSSLQRPRSSLDDGVFPSSEHVITICYQKNKRQSDVFTITETDLLQIPENKTLPGPYAAQKTHAIVKMMYGKGAEPKTVYTRFEQCIVDLRSTLTDAQRGDLPRDTVPADTTDWT